MCRISTHITRSTPNTSKGTFSRDVSCLSAVDALETLWTFVGWMGIEGVAVGADEVGTVVFDVTVLVAAEADWRGVAGWGWTCVGTEIAGSGCEGFVVLAV
jgi:hypothetical protein